MVRNVGKMDPVMIDSSYWMSLRRCSAIKLAGGKGTARRSLLMLGDDCNWDQDHREEGRFCRLSRCPRQGSVRCKLDCWEDVVRGLVVDLADVGSCCFPQVYSVIRDTEVNSGRPGGTNGWRCLWLGRLRQRWQRRRRQRRRCDDDDDGDDGGNYNCGVVDDDHHCSFVGRCPGQEDAGQYRQRPPPGFPKQENQGLLAVLERRRRVAYTIDLSYNLGNSSHFDVNDASQEKIVQAGRAGCAANYRPVLRPDPWRERVPSKKRLNRKRRRRRKHRDELTVAQNPIEDEVIATAATLEAAAVEPISVRLPKHVVTVSRQLSLVGRKRKPQVEPGMGTSANGGGVDGERKAVPRQPTAADLAIGGAYSTKKKRAGDVQGLLRRLT
ncbi:hypothetical protein MHU86_24861 [Fragilaria crotonensis]|nr:hypothetical protein MHU86_24861 [Fragilaria crotonensis]